jgi:alpha-amylase
MSKKAVVLYLHVHQPYRIRHYSVFDITKNHNYFEAPYESDASNERILKKVAEKSYLPTNQRLLTLLNENPEFKLSLSITGIVLEQMQKWSPETLDSFKKLVDTGRVEILGETYHHTLAFFYSQSEFDIQVQMHKEKVEEIFGVTPKVFRNTELSYNNQLALWADRAGYKGILAEGWDPILGWRSPNYVYQPVNTNNIKLLLKNYKLSDDIAFRFGDQDWKEWPLTADKFSHWISEDPSATNFNLFMDYETFGEHQWKESGIFDFLETFPREWLKTDEHSFMTVSEAIDEWPAVDCIDVPNTVTWADTERDLSAWLGNGMQTSAINSLYGLEGKILGTNDLALIDDWRRLQTSDHFYYMCTKWFNDGDVHAYFSPYESPYLGYLNFMNSYHDIKARMLGDGVEI